MVAHRRLAVFQGTFRDSWAAAKMAEFMAVRQKPRYRVLRVVKDWGTGTAYHGGEAIALALGGSEYEPEQFPGLIYRIQEPKTAILLFRSGKVVCTGAKSLENVKTAIDLVSKQIQAAGIPIKKDPEIEVQNIVATSDLGAQIDLNAVAITLGLGPVEYAPEQFPGLVYRIDEPKVVLVMFGSGKVV